MKSKFTKDQVNLFYKTLNEFKLEVDFKGNKKQRQALELLMDHTGKFKDVEEVGL
jgi:hypothetical protein